MAEGTFSCDAMVRGYHVYKDIWVATDGEFLQNYLTGFKYLYSAITIVLIQ